MFTTHERNKNRLKIATLSCLVFIIVFAAFSPCLKNNFTNWDDDGYITKNPVVQSLSSANLKKIFTSFFVGNYQPVTIISFLLEFHFFKFNPFGYHLDNLILHLLNCLLVFWLVFIFTGKVSVSWITAVLFGIHPLQVESVAWVSERKNVLYAFFFLGAIVCYLYYLRKGRVLKYYYFSLFLFVLSVLSKSMAVTLPLVLFLIDFFYRRKDKGMFIEKIPFFVLSLVSGIIAIFGVYASGAIRQEGVYNLPHRLMTASYGIVFYFNKLLVPLGLSALYPYRGMEGHALYLYSLALMVILAIAIILSGRYTKKIIFGSSLFLVTILPALQFIPNGAIIVADRYVYIPSIGIFYILAEGFAWLFVKRKRYAPIIQAFLLTMLIGMISGLAQLTWKRCRVWADSVTLWSDVLSHYPGVATGYKNRGEGYIVKGNIDQAIFDFTRAIYLMPADPGLYVNLGNAYASKGNFEQAFFSYDKALQIDPVNAEAYYNRAVAYFLDKKYDNAWQDVYKAERLGYEINLVFIEDLKRASRRGR